MNSPVYLTAGYNTLFLGTGRKEFHPKKPRPGIEHYITDAGQGAISQVQNPDALDEAVISNFMAARFCKQGNLAAFMPGIHPALRYKPSTRVEGACGSGGLGVYTAIKSILAGTSQATLAVGVEVQNSVKAVYGADFLAGAGWFSGERKNGHAHFFPNKFSERAGACYQKYGQEPVRTAMAHWYKQAIENARREPNAQEYHNRTADLLAVGMTPPNPRAFVEHLNVFDCSKVTDGGSGVIAASAEGLKRLGVELKDAIEVVGFGIAVDDITKPPEDQTRLTTSAAAAKKAFSAAGIGPSEIGVLEIHDCFTITALLAVEAAGFVKEGEGMDFIREGKTRYDAQLPTNSTGGLIGFGHPTGGTGVRQAADLWRQLTGRAGDCQVKINADRPYGMMINMGGNDKTVVAIIFRAAA